MCDPVTVACREPCGDFCDPFSVVLLPDTQYYTSKLPNNASNTYRKQMQWVIDHRASDNIQFVIHLGDVTNNNDIAQWDAADAAHAMLDNAGIPYSIVTGNHDYLVSGEFDRGGSHFDQYFGPDRFSGTSWYGGGYGSGNTSSFTLFEVGPMKFMVISLEYAPRKDVLCWADDLIAAHPDRRVIIATHCYLTHGGGYSAGCPDAEYNAIGANGSTVFDELVARHSNIFLVVSGHVGDSEYRTVTGNNGNTVHEMLVDYQFEGSCTGTDPAECSNNCRAGTYTGNGWMRELTFDPRAEQIHAETFTVEDGNAAVFPNGEPALFCSSLLTAPGPGSQGGNWYSSDPASSDHRFDFDYDMTTPVDDERNDLGKTAFLDRTVNAAGSGDQLAPKVAMAPSGAWIAVWEDDSSAADGAGHHDIKARGFASGGCAGFPELVVNPVTDGHQQTPAMAVDAAGNFVVVWADDRDDNGVFQLNARGLAADGSERIPVFTVNSAAQGQQTAPVVAMAPDGRFVVAWEDDPASDGRQQILVRGFAPDGTQSFADRSVHDDVAGQRIRPAIGMDANAEFVVAWQDDSDGNGTYQIKARGFDASGAPRFAAMTVNSVAQGQQRNPAIGVSATGRFVVGWEDDQDGDGLYQIIARGFDASGAGVLADFDVPASPAGQHLHPAIAMAPDGSFGAAWQDDGDHDGEYDIRARSFRPDGTAWLSERTVNRVTSGQELAPGVAMSESGSVVGIWQDDMDGNGSYQIVARGYDSP